MIQCCTWHLSNTNHQLGGQICLSWLHWPYFLPFHFIAALRCNVWPFQTIRPIRKRKNKLRALKKTVRTWHNLTLKQISKADRGSDLCLRGVCFLKVASALGQFLGFVFRFYVRSRPLFFTACKSAPFIFQIHK